MDVVAYAGIDMDMDMGIGHGNGHEQISTKNYYIAYRTALILE